MANVKDLIVNGATRIIGKVYAPEFVGELAGNVTGNVTGSSGSCTGNAASATTLQTSRTINGTSFNGSADITTANWGTARNISITDSSGTNTGTAVSVNGSDNATLKLPATIEATFSGNLTGDVTGNVSGSSGSCTGNAATATKLGTSTVGGTTTPIYINAGTPTALSYTIAKSVPSDAVFTDTKVKQSVLGSGHTTYRPLLIGDSNSSTKDFTPTTTTSIAYACASIYVQPDSGLIHGTKVEGAVWNDLADSIPLGEGDIVEPGYCYCFDGEHYTKTSEYMQYSYIGIHSDTYGFRMGAEGNKEKLDVAVSGFVLAYVDKDYPVGTPLTCTKDGYLTEISKEDKRDNPEMVIAKYWKSEPSEEWGTDSKKVKVNGRKWVKIK